MGILILRSSIVDDSVTPIFGESFESLSIGASVANTTPSISAHSGCRWLNRDGGSNGANINVQTIGGQKCLRFPYVADGVAGPGGRQEQRYNLDNTGAQQYRELWAEYQLYIPVGWVHSMDSGGGGGGANCKQIFFYNDDTGGRNYYDFEAWPINTSGGVMTPPAGSLYIDMQLKTNGTSFGFGNTFNAPHTTTYNFHATKWFGKDYAYIDSGTDAGLWLSFRYWVKQSTASGANDARVRVWKNSSALGGWTKILEFLDFNDWNTGTNAGGHSNHHMSGGYILGAHNYNYAADTTYGWDNFNIYASDPGWGLS